MLGEEAPHAVPGGRWGDGEAAQPSRSAGRVGSLGVVFCSICVGELRAHVVGAVAVADHAHVSGVLEAPRVGVVWGVAEGGLEGLDHEQLGGVIVEDKDVGLVLAENRGAHPADFSAGVRVAGIEKGAAVGKVLSFGGLRGGGKGCGFEVGVGRRADVHFGGGVEEVIVELELQIVIVTVNTAPS